MASPTKVSQLIHTVTRAGTGPPALLFVGAGTFFFWLSLYLYVPILPLYAESLGASLSMVGAVVASYAIAQVLLRIPIGVAADLVGRRKPFAVGALVVSTAGALGLAASPTPLALFGARALTGVGAAGWVAISVLYASYYRPERAGVAMSRVMAINTAALVLATSAGGIISEKLGPESTFYAGAAAGAVGTIFLLSAPEPQLPRRRSYSRRTFLRILRAPLLLSVGGIGILFQFISFGGTFGFVPVYAERIGASDAGVGYITTTILATSVLGTLVAMPLVTRIGMRGGIFVAALILAGSLVWVPAVHSVPVLGLSQGIGGIGRGLLNTLLMGLSLRSAAPQDRATAMGIFQAIYAIGMVSGPVVAGLVADSLGLASVFYLLAGVALVCAAAGLARVIPRV